LGFFGIGETIASTFEKRASDIDTVIYLFFKYEIKRTYWLFRVHTYEDDNDDGKAHNRFTLTSSLLKELCDIHLIETT